LGPGEYNIKKLESGISFTFSREVDNVRSVDYFNNYKMEQTNGLRRCTSAVK